MTSEKLVLSVKKREILGKKTKQLRAQGLAVGNVVTPKESIAISTDALYLKRIYEKAGESTLVYLTLEGRKKQIPTLIKEVDFDPLQGGIFHVVFYEVSLKENVEAAVPIEFIGEFNVPGASLIKVQDTVDISALPTDLPDNFEVNVEDLKEVGDQITLADIKFDNSIIELVLPEEVSAEDQVIAIAQAEAEEEPEQEETEEDSEDSSGEQAEGGTEESGDDSTNDKE